MKDEPNNEIAAELARYVQTWVRVLTAVRGCSPDEAHQWAAPFLRSQFELILHEPATFWVAPALVPAEFVATLARENLGRLHADLQFALDRGNSFWEPKSDGEIELAHQRVLAVLNDYRALVPPNAVADVILTDLPQSECMEFGVRVITLQWRQCILIDPARGREFGRNTRVAFGKASRLIVSGPDGESHLWRNAFGLNLVVVTSQREMGIALLETARLAFKYNNYRGTPKKLSKVAA